MNAVPEGLKYDDKGLIPAIVSDADTGHVLMMAWMNRESLAMTIETKRTHFFSRSRNTFWMKGESSGHVQHVESIRTDCDADVLLVAVRQTGAACHEGYRSCFFRELDDKNAWKVTEQRLVDPEAVYGKKTH